MNKIVRQVRKKTRLVSSDLVFRYRLAVEEEKKKRESLIYMVDKSQEALLFFEQILCSTEKMAD
ncbi:11657_t:CDS:1, partial [Entrophospora sp. SA101]